MPENKNELTLVHPHYPTDVIVMHEILNEFYETELSKSIPLYFVIFLPNNKFDVIECKDRCPN